MSWNSRTADGTLHPEKKTVGACSFPFALYSYINDIVTISDTLQMILFADDTNLFLSGPNLDDICTQLNI